MDDLISVIVPVYNAEFYLRQCIDSIIKQTYTNLEIVLVNDGSTDNSGKICDEYKEIDSRIKVIHKMNGGVSSARNAGLDVCTSGGDYIAFVDSDDWIESDMFEKLYNEIKRVNGDIVVCGYYIDKQDQTYIKKLEKGIFVGNDNVLKKCFYNKNFPNAVWCKLYNKNIFNEVRFPEGKLYEDMLIILDVLEKTSVVSIIPEAFYHYSQRLNSIMNEKTYHKSFEKILACENILEKVKVRKPDLMNLAYSQLYKHYMYFLDDIIFGRINVPTNGVTSEMIKKYFQKNILEILKNLNVKSKNKLMYIIISLNLTFYKMFVEFVEKVRK